MKIQDTINQNMFYEGKKDQWNKGIHYITFALLTLVVVATTSFNGMAQRGSLNLEGDGDYATAQDDATLDISATNITLEAWVKHDGNSDEDAVVLSKGTTGSGYKLWLYQQGDETYVRFAIGDLNSTVLTSEMGVPANRWSHVSATYDGQFMKIYLNGQLDVSMASSRSINDNNYNLYLGTKAAVDGQFFSGEMDEVRIWNVTRNATEIESSYMKTLTGSEAGLVSYYTFDDVSGTPIADDAGSNALNLVGSEAKIVTPGALPIAPDLYTQNKNAQIELSWDERLDNGSDNAADEFKVYRSTQADGSDRQELAAIASGTTSYTDTDVTNGTNYFYEVTSINASGDESDFSHMVPGTPYATQGGGSLALTKNSYGFLTDRPSLDITEQRLTVQVWVKHDGQSDEDAIIVTKGTTTSGYLLRFEGTGQAPYVAFAVGDLNSTILTSNSSIPANQWTHIAATYDGSMQQIYVNGQLDATMQTSRVIGGNDYGLYVGVDAAASNQFFSGHIDELAIWETPLSRQEIENSYNTPLSGNEEGLALYYRFDDASSTIPRSMDTYHTDMELFNITGSAILTSPGVFPLAPNAYALGGNEEAEVTLTDRDKADPAQHKIYRASVQDFGDRAEIALLSQGVFSYTDVSVTNENSYYYQATAINANGQESDYSFMKAARISEYPAGNALLLDGDNDYVRFDDRNSLDGYKQLYENFDRTITLEAWIKHDGNSDEDAIIVTKGSTSAGYLLRLEGVGENPRIAFAIGDLNSTLLYSNYTLPMNEWVHVSVVYNGTDMIIYINGEVDATGTSSRTVGSNSHRVMIGAPTALDGKFYSGELDEIRIWNSARSETEVADNYYKKLSGSQEDLIAYFRFDENQAEGQIVTSDITYSSARRAMSGGLFGDATYTNSNALSSQPVIANRIPEITLDEDFGTYTVADLDTVFQDDDTPNLSYSIVVPCHIVEAEIQNDTSLVFTSLENIFGTDTLTVEATDGATTARQSFIVNVESVNDVPELAGFENNLQVPINGEYTADMYARTADVESADSALAFSYAADTSGINIDFDGQILTLSPSGNFDGSGTLDIEVTDEAGETTSISVGVDMVTGTDIVDEPGIPQEFELSNNYPNPFNPTTTIQYALPEAADVRLTVFNSIGQKVADLVNTRQAAGTHEVQFDAVQLPSGMYIYRLKAGEFEQIRKMTLVK